MIKVFSTYTKDTIYNVNSGEKITRDGGPAFFIENVFKKNKIKYIMNAHRAKIKIEVKDGIEKGVLDGSLKTREIESIRDNDIVVISTVNKEWVLSSNLLNGAKIFLDVQGYVRNARKNRGIYKLDFWNNLFCIKINNQEIKELPKKIINNQRKKCLIITKGSKGAVIYFKNKKHSFVAKKIKPKDTIGAGDTFFAEFIVEFVKSKGDIAKSGKLAAREVEKFLSKK
jgi:bifunctional ADP-heptose synthase (sugar kinase/adenylyltransferase)